MDIKFNLTHLIDFILKVKVKILKMIIHVGFERMKHQRLGTDLTLNDAKNTLVFTVVFVFMERNRKGTTIIRAIFHVVNVFDMMNQLINLDKHLLRFLAKITWTIQGTIPDMIEHTMQRINFATLASCEPVGTLGLDMTRKLALISHKGTPIGAVKTLVIFLGVHRH
jgi:hypothetical protein